MSFDESQLSHEYRQDGPETIDPVKQEAHIEEILNGLEHEAGSQDPSQMVGDYVDDANESFAEGQLSTIEAIKAVEVGLVNIAQPGDDIEVASAINKSNYEVMEGAVNEYAAWPHADMDEVARELDHAHVLELCQEANSLLSTVAEDITPQELEEVLDRIVASGHLNGESARLLTKRGRSFDDYRYAKSVETIALNSELFLDEDGQQAVRNAQYLVGVYRSAYGAEDGQEVGNGFSIEAQFGGAAGSLVEASSRIDITLEPSEFRRQIFLHSVKEYSKHGFTDLLESDGEALDLDSRSQTQLKALNSTVFDTDKVPRNLCELLVGSLDMDVDEEQFVEQVEVSVDLAKELVDSSSGEMKSHARAILRLAIESEDPKSFVADVSEIFTNNVPTPLKKFQVYKLLHKSDEFQAAGIPVLEAEKVAGRNPEDTIKTDLIRASIDSDNSSLRRLFEDIVRTEDLVGELNEGATRDWESLEADEMEQLNSLIGSLRGVGLVSELRRGQAADGVALREQYQQLQHEFGVTDEAAIGDRVAKMIGYPLGLYTAESVLARMDEVRSKADQRGRQLAASPDSFRLHRGDIIKGALHSSSDIEWLSDMLDSGVVAKEFLGTDAGSDNTPLDTDFSVINGEYETLASAVKTTHNATESYGDVSFVLQNRPGRFLETVRGDELGGVKEDEDYDKLELVHDRAGNGAGIRTGFGSTEIDFIVIGDKVASYDLDQIKLAIAEHGSYIPIVQKSSEELAYTPEEFDKLRATD